MNEFLMNRPQETIASTIWGPPFSIKNAILPVAQAGPIPRDLHKLACCASPSPTQILPSEYPFPANQAQISRVIYPNFSSPPLESSPESEEGTGKASMEEPLLGSQKGVRYPRLEYGNDGRQPNSLEAEANGAGDVSEVEDAPPVRCFGDAWEVFVRESKKLWAITAPIGFSIICLYGLNSATQIFAGHLGNLELSAVAIGLSVICNFSFGFLLGMGSALETLCGQAFGAGQVEKLGVYMQRSWVILLVSALLLCPLYIFATPILKLIGQQDDIAEAAGRFSIFIIPQVFAQAINFPTQKFLQAQSKVGILAWIGFAALLLHVALLSLFLYTFGWGIAGAAAAFNISQWTVTVSQIIYVMVWCREGWTGFSWAAFRDLWAFVKLSLASAVMLCLEIWYMMVLVVLTGHLKNAEIAVGSISICMNINGWEGMIFIGINAAISVRVSNELGSGRSRATKHAVVVVVATSLVIGVFFMFVILAARDYFPLIFTSDKELQHAVTRIAYLLGITMVLNSVQPVISGVAVGGGWQGLVAYINLGCYYVFGLPLGFFLGYGLRWGVQGIWVGMLCGTALQTLILLFIIWKTNWKEEAAQASERVKLWGGEKNPPLNLEK